MICCCSAKVSLCKCSFSLYFNRATAYHTLKPLSFCVSSYYLCVDGSFFRPSSSRHSLQNCFPVHISFGNSCKHFFGSTHLGSEVTPPLQCRLPTGGGFVFIFCVFPISAGVGVFSLSSRELELEPHSLLSLE